MAHEHDLHPPKLLLGAAIGLVVFALAGTAFVRLTETNHISDWQSRSTDAIDLRFADAPDGGVIALDAATGRTVHAWAPETGGFVRTAMRALTHDRKQAGIGDAPAFRLHRIDNDQFIIEDPATGQWVGLNAFGRDNVAEFAQLFDDRSTAR